MCGLVGVYAGNGGTVSRELLYAMGGELVHRGPDGTGAYFDRGLGMLSTRLSIVDIGGGDQPLPNETSRYWVMQNGEIFNHPELRTELESRGHRFTTHCDTEVLVHAFEEWGAACLDRLNGEFAFAIGIARRRRSSWRETDSASGRCSSSTRAGRCVSPPKRRHCFATRWPVVSSTRPA